MCLSILKQTSEVINHYEDVPMLRRVLLTAIVIGLYLVYLIPAFAGDNLQLGYVENIKPGARQAVIRERIKRNDNENDNENNDSMSEVIDTYERGSEQDIEQYDDDTN